MLAELEMLKAGGHVVLTGFGAPASIPFSLRLLCQVCE
jgi:hypothetical protein